MPEDRLLAAHRALTGSLVASELPEEGWYSVAEAAVCALYALHPRPAQLSEAVLRSQAKSAMAAIQEGEGWPSIRGGKTLTRGLPQSEDLHAEVEAHSCFRLQHTMQRRIQPASLYLPAHATRQDRASGQRRANGGLAVVPCTPQASSSSRQLAQLG